MTVEAMKATIVENADKLAALNLDWNKLLELLDKAPVVIALLKQLITLFADDKPLMASHHDDECCDHQELCRRTLQSTLCAACCAAKHYEVCCAEKCE